MYKIFKHRKLPCNPCFGETHISSNDTTFFLHFFSLFCFCNTAFSTPITSSNLRNQAPLLMELYLLQDTLNIIENPLNYLKL